MDFLPEICGPQGPYMDFQPEILVFAHKVLKPSGVAQTLFQTVTHTARLQDYARYLPTAGGQVKDSAPIPAELR